MDNYIIPETDAKELCNKNKCDKWDYLISVCTGALAGIVDIFFVGSPVDSKLLHWTDSQTNKFVEKFAKLNGWSPREGNENNLKSAVGFLEKKYPVNYDQANSASVDNMFKMGAQNHHMKSLAHSPSIVGLFFSVVNQFTGTSSFLNNGQLITIQSDGQLMGGDFPSKLFSACVNWIGHLVSDVAGSSGAVGRGSGIVAPFYELFGLCDFGQFKINEANGKPNIVSLGQLATRAFQEGYDLRFAATQAIPVVISDLLTRFIWAFRQHFQYKKPLNECIPTKKHDELRIMLIVSNGVLCLMDGVDAAIRSGGDWLRFFLRLNLVAWCRLIIAVVKEICIRAKIKLSETDVLGTIRTAVDGFLADLKNLNERLFECESNEWDNLMNGCMIGQRVRISDQCTSFYDRYGNYCEFYNGTNLKKLRYLVTAEKSGMYNLYYKSHKRFTHIISVKADMVEECFSTESFFYEEDKEKINRKVMCNSPLQIIDLSDNTSYNNYSPVKEDLNMETPVSLKRKSPLKWIIPSGILVLLTVGTVAYFKLQKPNEMSVTDDVSESITEQTEIVTEFESSKDTRPVTTEMPAEQVTEIVTEEKTESVTVLETTLNQEQITETVNSDKETFSIYYGGIENPRIYAFVRQNGNEFEIKIKWGSSAFSHSGYVAYGTVDPEGYCNADMTEYYVDNSTGTLNCEIYDNVAHDIRFYPENDMITWDDIVLTKEPDEEKFVTGTVNIEDGVLNVRKSNNADSEIIGTLNKDDVVTIIEDLEGWYMIISGNKIGIVSADYIKLN